MITKLKQIKDERGKLIVFEKDNNLTFDLKRTYFIYYKSSLDRGFHAHYNTNQLLVCLNGTVKIVLDDGYKKTKITLNNSENSIFVPKMIWHYMTDASSDCIMAVMADKLYDKNDYIRDYSKFINEIK